MPGGGPYAALAAASDAAGRVPDAHRDQSAERFVTLDPASSTDLDQAFALEWDGGSEGGADLILHYAIADAAWFVADGGVIDLPDEVDRTRMSVYFSVSRKVGRTILASLDAVILLCAALR